MCLIVHAPAGTPIPAELIHDAYQGNSDGFGLMWFEPGAGVRVVKHHDAKPKAIIKACERAEKFERVLHMRFATHGAVDDANTHPFKVTDDVWMMHNGVLHMDGQDIRSTQSDTGFFAEHYVTPVLKQFPDALQNSGMLRFIDEMCGSSNRLVFMDNSGRVTIVGRDRGVEWRGLWCSNTYAWSLHTPRPARSYGRRWEMVSPKTANAHPMDDGYAYDEPLFDRSMGTPLVDKETGMTYGYAPSPVYNPSPVHIAPSGLSVYEDDDRGFASASWLTSRNQIIPGNIADVLMASDHELIEVMSNEPEEILEFIEWVRTEHTGEPVDTVDEPDYAG